MNQNSFLVDTFTYTSVQLQITQMSCPESYNILYKVNERSHAVPRNSVSAEQVILFWTSGMDVPQLVCSNGQKSVFFLFVSGDHYDVFSTLLTFSFCPIKHSFGTLFNCGVFYEVMVPLTTAFKLGHPGHPRRCLSNI